MLRRFFLPCLVVRTDAQEEQKRVHDRAVAMSEDSAADGSTFWLDQNKGRKLPLLQDRVSAVGDFLEQCRRRFSNIYKAMFPLNPPVESFRGLMSAFSSMSEVCSSLRAQLVAGVQLGLSFVLARHPHLNVDVIPDLPFDTPDPRATIDLSPQYAATEHAARKIVSRMLAEEERLLYPIAGSLYLPPVKEGP